MRFMVTTLLAAGLLALGSPLATAQTSPSGTATQTVAKGACVVKHSGGTVTCIDNIDQGGCRANGLETGATATWQPGQSCPAPAAKTGTTAR